MVSRIASVVCVLMVACGATMFACGDDGGSGTQDAKLPIDAKVFMDAAQAMGLGMICTGNANACPTTDPACVRVGDSTVSFCTKTCGTTTTTTPPAGGNDICKMNEMTSGTPACVIYSAGSGSSAGTYTWYCAITCGVLNGMQLGTCPAGLTCYMGSGSATYGYCR